MKPENAIEVNNVSKSFKVYPDKGNTLKERALFSARRRYEKRDVLNDLTFEVKKGEAVGIIGHNGCGKSTLLKLLTKIMYPDSGRIDMRGRVSSLIELGAGFHPDMSGRDNIYINASIFGLTKNEIERRIDDIINFSEINEFIDNPVRTYSSGMYMRLAFSVAINVDAEILLIDEILAVGDAGFQAKCFNKLEEIKNKGTTIVIVSHSLGQIEQICDRSIWIDKGKIAALGNPYEVHPLYLDYIKNGRRSSLSFDEHSVNDKDIEEISTNNNSVVIDMNSGCGRSGSGQVRIKSVKLYNSDGELSNSYNVSDRIIVKIDYHVIQAIDDAIISVAILRSDGMHFYGTNTKLDLNKYCTLSRNGSIRFVMDNIELMPSTFYFDIGIERGCGGIQNIVDYYPNAAQFDIRTNVKDIGLLRVSHKWFINE